MLFTSCSYSPVRTLSFRKAKGLIQTTVGSGSDREIATASTFRSQLKVWLLGGSISHVILGHHCKNESLPAKTSWLVHGQCSEQSRFLSILGGGAITPAYLAANISIKEAQWKVTHCICINTWLRSISTHNSFCPILHFFWIVQTAGEWLISICLKMGLVCSIPVVTTMGTTVLTQEPPIPPAQLWGLPHFCQQRWKKSPSGTAMGAASLLPTWVHHDSHTCTSKKTQQRWPGATGISPPKQQYGNGVKVAWELSCHPLCSCCFTLIIGY